MERNGTERLKNCISRGSYCRRRRRNLSEIWLKMSPTSHAPTAPITPYSRFSKPPHIQFALASRHLTAPTVNKRAQHPEPACVEKWSDFIIMSGLKD